ncbi:hypothetical protein SO802_015960 [Lithocarpus litseifolius]|uniref:CCHC-type domain-containing protein n=1 Tax=Lithocarpus litseifolius TaxID=425828 RepID=A0AAW2CWH1_9ROSI
MKRSRQEKFSEGVSETDLSPRSNNIWDLQNKSFKEKLVGEIPGAYAQAFDFYDLLEDDVESDDEVTGLREGLAAVKLSKETKLRIRGSWSKALIVKLYGRKIGFNFFQNKLQQLWKPSGRLDCVDLGNEFFLTRFSLKEDLDAVLRRGPWFIGEHFLSIRPWEPFFKPEAANVSSIAVWVRLHALPIELYDAEVLKQIGEAIGKVLRIDTHTAMEARGKYARLCIQVDVDKPLVNTVLIGKFEQAVMYEGINKLCFACGRIGHKKEMCPHTIRRDVLPPEKEASSTKVSSTSPRKMHVSGGSEAGRDMAECSAMEHGMAESSGMVHVEDNYGPWIVVTRRKGGQRGTTKGVQLMDPAKSDPSSKPRTSLAKGMPSNGHNVWKEATKMGFTTESNMERAGHSGLFLGRDVKSGGFMDNVGAQTKAQVSPSVKGKKVIARNKGLPHLNRAIASSSKPLFTSDSQASPFLGNIGTDASSPFQSSPFQFSSAPQAELGNHGRDRGHGDQNGSSNEKNGSYNGKIGEDGVGNVLIRSAPDGSLETSTSLEGKECRTGLSTISGTTVEEVYREGDVKGLDLVQDRSSKVLNGKDGGEDGEDGMEFEEGGEFVTSA